MNELVIEFAKDQPVCPTCTGYVAVVLKRAWCLMEFARGGCGSHWTLRDQRWHLVRDATTR